MDVDTPFVRRTLHEIAEKDSVAALEKEDAVDTLFVRRTLHVREVLMLMHTCRLFREAVLAWCESLDCSGTENKKMKVMIDLRPIVKTCWSDYSGRTAAVYTG